MNDHFVRAAVFRIALCVLMLLHIEFSSSEAIVQPVAPADSAPSPAPSAPSGKKTPDPSGARSSCKITAVPADGAPPISIQIRKTSSENSNGGYIVRATLAIQNNGVVSIRYTLKLTADGLNPASKISNAEADGANGGKVSGDLPQINTRGGEPITISAKDLILKSQLCHSYDVTLTVEDTTNPPSAYCSDKSRGFSFTVDAESKNGGSSAAGCIQLPTSLPVRSKIVGDQVSVSSLLIEKAIIQKTLADEFYLTGNVLGAKKKYAEAQSTVAQSSEVQDLGASNRAIARLLNADIDYRLTLLRANIDFWGGYRGKTPGIPIRHLIALEDLVQEFDRVAGQIGQFSSAQADADKEILKAKAALADLNGKLGAYVAEQERGVITEKRERRGVDLGQRKLSSIDDAQVKIASRMDALAAQQDNLQKQSGALLVKAIGSVSGVDPAMIDAARTGDIKTLATSYIRSQLADPNSDISSAVSGISGDADKFTKLYREAKEKLEDAQELKSDIETAAEEIRNPTAANLRKLGASIWNQLPPDQKKALEGQLRDKISAVEWVRVAQEKYSQLAIDPNALRADVAQALQDGGLTQEAARKLIGPALQKLVSEQEKGIAELDAIAHRVQKALIEGAADARGVSDGLEAVIKAAPKEFLQSCPDPLKSMLRQHYRVANDDQLAAQLGAGIGNQLNVVLTQTNRIVIESRTLAARVEVERSDLTKTRLTQDALSSAVAQSTTLLDTLVSQGSDKISLVLAQMPLPILSTKLNDFNSPAISKFIRDSTLARLPDDSTRSSLSSGAMAGVVGVAYGQEAVRSIASSDGKLKTAAVEATSAGPSDLGANDGGIDPATNLALTAALNAAFPGAGVALQMAQNFAAASANASLLDKLANEDARLMAEKLELLDRQTERYYDAAIAEKDQERAEALLEASKEQIKIYQDVMQKSVEEANTEEAKVGLRRGWAFYLAERMREEFDLYDRSFSLWSRGAASRGVIDEEIRADPQNVRYALDSDIHLYDWLNRSRESTRTDPDLLRVHWSQMLRLAKDVCQRRGCKPGDGLLGQVGSTRPVGLVSELLASDERQRFRDWQKKPVGRFQTEVFISPMINIVPLALENIRLIDVRLSAEDSKRQRYSPGPITIRHTGVSYIPRLISENSKAPKLLFTLESMAPRSMSSFDVTADFDLNALRVRYDNFFTGSNLPSARPFEGYGLYARYAITIEPVKNNQEAEDFILVFSYFYIDSTVITNERQFISALRDDSPIAGNESLELHDDTSECSITGVTNTKRVLSNVHPSALSFISGRRTEAIEKALPSASMRTVSGLQKCASVVVVPTCRKEAALLAEARSVVGRKASTAIRDESKLGTVELLTPSVKAAEQRMAKNDLDKCIAYVERIAR